MVGPPTGAAPDAARARRVVSLVPAATEVLCALGLGAPAPDSPAPDSPAPDTPAPDTLELDTRGLGGGLVGITDDCPQVPGVPLVVRSMLPAGLDQSEIDALVSSRLRAGLPLREVRSELLRTLAPEVVVAQDLCAVCAVGTAETARALDMVGSPAVLHVYDPHRLAELAPAVRELAAACGLTDAGAALAASLTERLDALRARVALGQDAGWTPPRVVVLEWTDPLWAAGHWVPDVVAAAGGLEVLGAAGGASVWVDRAAVLAARPDVVVVAPCGLPLTDAVDAARTVRAWLPAGTRVLAADGTVLTGAGPGLVDLAETLAGRLVPVTSDRCAHPAGSDRPEILEIDPMWAEQSA